MSIKSEIRLLEQQNLPVTNPNFKKGIEGWTGTGSTTWVEGSFNNVVRKISGNTTKIGQTITYDNEVNTVSLTYFPGSRPIKVKYSIMGDNDTTSSFTPYVNGVAGTTRTNNGTYYDIFYVGDGKLLTINGDDYFLIGGANLDVLIWG